MKIWMLIDEPPYDGTTIIALWRNKPSVEDMLPALKEHYQYRENPTEKAREAAEAVAAKGCYTSDDIYLEEKKVIEN